MELVRSLLVALLPRWVGCTAGGLMWRQLFVDLGAAAGVGRHDLSLLCCGTVSHLAESGCLGCRSGL